MFSPDVSAQIVDHPLLLMDFSISLRFLFSTGLCDAHLITHLLGLRLHLLLQNQPPPSPPACQFPPALGPLHMPASSRGALLCRETSASSPRPSLPSPLQLQARIKVSLRGPGTEDLVTTTVPRTWNRDLPVGPFEEASAWTLSLYSRGSDYSPSICPDRPVPRLLQRIPSHLSWLIPPPPLSIAL